MGYVRRGQDHVDVGADSTQVKKAMRVDGVNRFESTLFEDQYKPR